MPDTVLGSLLLWYAIGLAVVAAITIISWWGGDDVTVGTVLSDLMMALLGPIWLVIGIILLITDVVVPVVRGWGDRVLVPGRRDRGW